MHQDRALKSEDGQLAIESPDDLEPTVDHLVDEGKARFLTDGEDAKELAHT